MKTSTLRRLACGALLTGSAWLALTALDGAAHADDGPQRPGGALGAVVEVVDQAVPDVEPTRAPEPEPTKEPAAAAEPSDEPSHDTDGQDEQPIADEPAEEPAPADPVETVTDPVETVVEVVTAPVAPTPTPAPVITPTPAPTPVQPSTPAQSQPETTTVPAPTTPEPQVPAVDVVAVPVDELPVVIGPVAGTATLLPGLTPTPGVDTAQPAADEPQCTGEQPAATPDHGRGVVRTITDRRTGLPAAQQPPTPLTPCPQPPPATDQAINAVATAGHAGQHSDQYAATTTELAWPALGRLHQLRARGDVPASRTEHPEPGPA